MNLKLKDKLSILKSKVKEIDRTNRTRDISLDQIKPAEKSIRLICEQEVNLKDQLSPATKEELLLNIGTSGLQQSSPDKSLRGSRAISVNRLAKLQGEMQKVVEMNARKKEEVERNKHNLSALKAELEEKVKKGNSPKKQVRVSTPKKKDPKPVNINTKK